MIKMIGVRGNFLTVIKDDEDPLCIPVDLEFVHVFLNMESLMSVYVDEQVGFQLFSCDDIFIQGHDIYEDKGSKTDHLHIHITYMHEDKS